MKDDISWSEIAFSNKREIKDLQATFILAPRDISSARLKQLVKQYLPQGNILLGLATEDYVIGFEGQPQFKMLKDATVQNIKDKVNSSDNPHKIYTITYSQRETKFLIEKLGIRRVVLMNGSWKHAFHHSELFYTLIKLNIPFEYASAYASEEEAREAAHKLSEQISALNPLPKPGATLSTTEMIQAAETAARYSFDYNFQIGVSLGSRTTDGSYQFLTAQHNNVVPYETYALLKGSIRERQYSPPQDLNHYDTVHAEVMALIACQKLKIDLQNSALFVNVLPCPTCARMICQTDISEVVYQLDHSDGYGLQLLEMAGKQVRRVLATT